MVDPENNWYAVLLATGALRPARERKMVVGARGGRYLRGVDLDRTCLAKAMATVGADLFHPTEPQTAVHRRTKKLETRHEPLIPGYAFVRGVRDFQALTDLPEIAAVMGNGPHRAPTIIHDVEIDRLRMAVEILDVEFERKQAALEAKAALRNAPTRQALEAAFPKHSKVLISEGLFAGQWATINEVTGRNAIKTMVEFLGGLVPAELRVDQLEISI